jgi:hypothetical protein
VAGIDPTGLFSLNGGAPTSRIQETTDKYCAQQKRRFEDGKMCEDEFKKRWKNGGCDENIGWEILKAAGSGFLEGAHDGAVVTLYHALDSLSFGLLGMFVEFDEDWLIDPDTPHLHVSAISGQLAGAALQGPLARFLGGAATAVHMNSALYSGPVRGYAIMRNGVAYKVGITGRGTNNAGNLRRAQKQVNKLMRQHPGDRWIIKQPDRWTFSNRCDALNWEGRIVERYRRIYPSPGLPGNPARPPY